MEIAAHCINATMRSLYEAGCLHSALPTAEAAGFLYEASLRLSYTAIPISVVLSGAILPSDSNICQ